nr:hypothetical protein [Sphingobium phenoxybenzoativorans]
MDAPVPAKTPKAAAKTVKKPAVPTPAPAAEKPAPRKAAAPKAASAAPVATPAAKPEKAKAEAKPKAEPAAAAAKPKAAPKKAAEPAAAKPAPAAPSAPDDLLLLKGVGPKLNTMLVDLGVTSFAQIAGWTDTDLAKVDAQLGAFKGRPVRDHWVDQAKYLAAGDIAGFEAKYGKL